MGVVPWHLLLVSPLLDLTVLLLAAFGIRVAWSRFRKKPLALPAPPSFRPVLDMTLDEMTAALRAENELNEQRIERLREQKDGMQRFLGFPAD